jgi:hypothetical protein
MTDHTTDLVFNIVEQLLTGSIDGTHIDARAVSGGRAGSKTKGVVDVFLANNPYATGLKKRRTRPGGPLPIARYRLKTHESRANIIRLNPFDGEYMKGRTGMEIHGRGPRGSDGCIVPMDFHVVQLLYKLVKTREDAKKAAPTLAVVAIGDLDFFDRLNRLA